MYRTITIIAVFSLLLTACGVPQEQHDEALSDLESTQIELSEQEQENEQLQEQIASLEQRIEELEAERAELQDQLEQAQGDLEMYEQETGSLEESLQASREELDELREARQQTEERLEVYRQLAEQLASMVESGQLSVEIRDGRMVINLDDEILFDSGSTRIKSVGQEALAELAGILQEVDREFLIAGHTDDVSLSSSNPYDSNWELSTARAVQVVEFLQEEGVSPGRLAAAGYGEHDPIASNETEETRALNRRIEIVLMPTIEELPTLPDDVFDETEETAQEQSEQADQ